MINKKLLLSFFMLFVFSLIAYAEDKKNFVTILNGSNVTRTSSTSYSFVGQPVVFNTKETNES